MSPRLALLRRPASELTDDELRTHDAELATLWDEIRNSDEELGGGSPGEWVWERSEEVATEQKRRAAVLDGEVRGG